MTFLYDQRTRLLRESWTADALAQELYSMFAENGASNTLSTVGISLPNGAQVAPITITNPTTGPSQIININRPGGTPYGSIVIVNNQMMFQSPNGQLLCPGGGGGSQPTPPPPPTLTTVFTLSVGASQKSVKLPLNGSATLTITANDSLGESRTVIGSISVSDQDPDTLFGTASLTASSDGDVTGGAPNPKTGSGTFSGVSFGIAGTWQYDNFGTLGFSASVIVTSE